MRGAESLGILSMSFHTFHGLGIGQGGRGAKSTSSHTEQHLEQKKLTACLGLPCTWFNAEVEIGLTPGARQLTQMDSVSISSLAMCSSCIAKISSGTMAIYVWAGFRVQTFTSLKECSDVHHLRRKSPKPAAPETILPRPDRYLQFWLCLMLPVAYRDR